MQSYSAVKAAPTTSKSILFVIAVKESYFDLDLKLQEKYIQPVLKHTNRSPDQSYNLWKFSLGNSIPHVQVEPIVFICRLVSSQPVDHPIPTPDETQMKCVWNFSQKQRVYIYSWIDRKWDVRWFFIGHTKCRRPPGLSRWLSLMISPYIKDLICLLLILPVRCEIRIYYKDIQD